VPYQPRSAFIILASLRDNTHRHETFIFLPSNKGIAISSNLSRLAALMLPDLATSSNTDTQRPGDIGIIGAATPKQGIARHYTSLKEHAFAVQYASLTPGGGESSGCSRGHLSNSL
jgi:hypothetical protein